MELDNRKLRILSAMVETYIATGEPVGSSQPPGWGGLLRHRAQRNGGAL